MRCSIRNAFFNKYAGLIAIALFIMLGAMAPVMTYAAVVLSFATACYLGYNFIIDPGPWAGKVIITLLCLQNLCIGIGAHLMENTDNSLMLLTQIPFMVIFVIWFIGLFFELKQDGIRKFLGNKTNLLFVILLVCIGISFIIGHGSIKSCLVSLRNMTVFYMTYSIGRKMCRDGEKNENTEDLKSYIRYFLILSSIMCVLGFVLMAGGYGLYKVLGVHEVYIAKGAPFAEGRLADVFLRHVRGKLVQRMSSIYYEPVNLAYLFAASVLCALFVNPFEKNPLRVLTILLSVIGLILTLGKGGYVIAAICVCCLIGAYIIRKLFKVDYKKCGDSTLLFSMILVAFAGVTAVITLLALFWEGRELIMPHIRGIAGAVDSITKRPWGYGLGNGGNAALIFNGNIEDASQWYSIGGETALMSFMYQIGVHGIIIFMMCVVSTGLRKVRKMSVFEKAVFCIPWALICVSVLQDNTFTPQCVVPFMLLIGMTGKVCLEGEEL